MIFGVVNGQASKVIDKPTIGLHSRILSWRTKLMNMSRENLRKSIFKKIPAMDGGKNTLIQLTLVATMSADSVVKKVQLNHQYTFFSECVALSDTRMGLFNKLFPMQQVGRESLRQVAELIFVDTVRDLIDSEQNSNINSMDGGYGLLGVCPSCSCIELLLLKPGATHIENKLTLVYSLLCTHTCLFTLVYSHLSIHTCLLTLVYSHLSTHTCLFTLVYSHLSTHTSLLILVYSHLCIHTCLLTLVYSLLSTHTCLLTLVYSHVSTYTCLLILVSSHLSTHTCLLTLVYTHLSPHTCLLTLVYSHLSTHICLLTLVYSHLSP